MRKFRNILFALVAMLWLPASVHCQMESVTGFGFLTCPADSASHDQASDCSDCCMVEKAQFRTYEIRIAVPLPALIAVLQDTFFLQVEVSRPQINSLIATAPPPEISDLWCSFSSTALPPRAPSIAS